MSGAADRVVEVFAPLGGDGRGRSGAGFLLGGGLVLTAGHVIEDATGACEVRALGDAGWTRATVLWCGERDGDGALLAVEGPLGDVARARLGRLVGAERVGCEATGFPWAQTERRDGAARHATEHLVGEVDRLSGRQAGVRSWLLTVHAQGSVPKPRQDGGSPWAGMSGAGLVCGQLLVGVVIVDPARFGPDRLLAVPLTALHDVPGFAAALAPASGEPPVLEAVEAQGVLERAYELPPPRRARQSSSFLLGARYRVVPFRPRGELDELHAWATSSEHLDVAVLTGGGGVGKSRLARELCAQLTDAGWVAGPLALDPTGSVGGLARVDGDLLVCSEIPSGGDLRVRCR